MPPEVVAGQPYDQRSDLYAVGVLLYRVAAGRMPFREADIRTVPHPAPFLSLKKVPKVPAEYVAVVERALAVDPAARHESAEQLALELDRVLDRMGFDPGQVPGWVASLFPAGEEESWGRGESQGSATVHTSLHRLVGERRAVRRSWVQAGLAAAAGGSIVGLITLVGILAVGGLRQSEGEHRAEQAILYLDAADDLLRAGHPEAARVLHDRAAALSVEDAAVVVRIARQRVAIEEASTR
jgi:hypothetical protein